MEKSETVYRHVVLFQFREETPPETLKAICSAFADLCRGLPMVKAFEGGVNSSPEGLDQGLTHCFFVTFADAAARDAYLPHPAHQAFISKWIEPHLAKVCVVDYRPEFS